MNDLTKKTLSVMWDQFSDVLKTLSIVVLVGSLGVLTIFAGAKILFMFRDYFDPFITMDECFLVSCFWVFFSTFIGVVLYGWYMDTRKAVAKYGTSKYGRDRYGKPSGLGGGK